MKPFQSEGLPPWWRREIAATRLGESGARGVTPLTGHTKAPVKPACKGQPERGESPPGAAFKGVWSSGPTGLPPSAVRARDRRLQPGGQRGVRAWPEKPKGNERKRKRKDLFELGRTGLTGVGPIR